MADKIQGMPFDLGDLPAVPLDLTSEELAEMADVSASRAGSPALEDLEDKLFSSLFARSSLAGIGVSPELASSTLDAIMAQASLDETGEAVASEAASGPKHLKLVEGGASEPAVASAAAVAAAPGTAAVAGQASSVTPRPQRTPRFPRLAAAAAACAALVLGGGFAYRTPTAYITVEGNDSSVQLGVNLFGVTVSATANNASGQQVVDGLGLGTTGYADTLREVAAAMGTQSGDSAMSVAVSSLLGNQRSDLEDQSARVLGELGVSSPSAQESTELASSSSSSSTSVGGSSSSSSTPTSSSSQKGGGSEKPAEPAAQGSEQSSSAPVQSEGSSAASEQGVPASQQGGSGSGSGSGASSGGSSSGSGTVVYPVINDDPIEPELPEGPVEDIDYSGNAPVDVVEPIDYGGREDSDPEADIVSELPAPPSDPGYSDGPNLEEAESIGISATF